MLPDHTEHKPLRWVGSSREDIRDLPAAVCDRLGFALPQVQAGLTPDNAKPLRGFVGAGVWELVEDYDTNAYRGVYAVCLAETVYVLHVFQKKSKHGSETPRQNMELIRAPAVGARQEPTTGRCIWRQGGWNDDAEAMSPLQRCRPDSCPYLHRLRSRLSDAV